MTLKIIMLSLRAIYNNKMRSFLTMLGIIIGVMAVVILVSITQNATSGITDSIASMGSDQITASITGLLFWQTSQPETLTPLPALRSWGLLKACTKRAIPLF